MSDDARRDPLLEREQVRLEGIAKADPLDPDVHEKLGLWLLGQNRPGEARSSLIRAISLSPKTAAFHHNLGVALQKLNRFSDAGKAYRQSIALDPMSADSRFSLAQLLLIQGESEACATFRQVYDLESNTSRGYFSLGYHYFLTAETLPLAEEPLRRAIQIGSKNSQAQALLGMTLLQLGRLEEGAAALREAIELDPSEPGPYLDLFLHKKVDESDRHLIEAAREMAEQPQRSLSDLRTLNFALGKAHNDLRSYEIAMSHYRLANRFANQIRNRPFDRESYSASVDRMISYLPIGEAAPIVSESDKPILIVGMFRSGTTLVEQILSSHPDVTGGGELSFWTENAQRAFGVPHRMQEAVTDEYLELLQRIGPGARRVTDKHPENFLLVGLLHALFPNAKIVCCRRNPIDNALSLFMTYFTQPPVYALDEDDIVFAFREHERLLRHWRRLVPEDRLLLVDYETVVTDFAASCRRLAEFCDLEWSENFLRPEENPRAVRTASQWQVRQPIYLSSVERWRNYEPYLGAFKELADLSS